MEFLEDGRLELYHLREDLGEATNLASSRAEKAAEMQARLAAWRDEVRALMPQRQGPDAPTGKAKPGKPRKQKAI